MSTPVRIPSIIGYVEHDIEDFAGEVAGILLQYVDADESMHFLCRPMDEGIEAPHEERKNKWNQHINQTVKWFHEHNLIWGDAKADNVLIDGQDNAWLIDFGGGFTPGWVDEKKRNSAAGDLQGLERIAAFLAGQDIQDEDPFASGQIDDEVEGDVFEVDQIHTVVDDSPARQHYK